MRTSDLRAHLATSLARQDRILRSTLILNPVENFPFASDVAPASGILHGLYNTDKIRTAQQQKQTAIQFSGRRRIAYDVRQVYKAWSNALGAADVTMRLLSGLHAHATVFMACSVPGQKVLLLPELAGGHVSTKAILERLGLIVVEMTVDSSNMRVDFEDTLAVARASKPDFVFVDRSEGLVYEDFSELVNEIKVPAIFDASQYLTNILAGDFASPFAMGFDYMIATLHKNFPGPQRAMLAAKDADPRWQNILSAISIYVSNMHVYGIYTAGLTLGRDDWLKQYSHQMLMNAVRLEHELAIRGVDVVRRPGNRPPTHHIWVRSATRDSAFEQFRSLERSRILVNFRKLPYGLGFGLRLGLSAATRIGLKNEHIPTLAELLHNILKDGSTPINREHAREFNEGLWAENEHPPRSTSEASQR